MDEATIKIDVGVYVAGNAITKETIGSGFTRKETHWIESRRKIIKSKRMMVGKSTEPGETSTFTQNDAQNPPILRDSSFTKRTQYPR